MAPMCERVIADDCTLIIRGQRNSDTYKSPLRSSGVENGVELLFPIEDCSAEDVMAYARSEGFEIPQFYDEGLNGSPDCMGCTAWWSERRGAYLKNHHPEAYDQYRVGLETIFKTIRDASLPLLHELGNVKIK